MFPVLFLVLSLAYSGFCVGSFRDKISIETNTIKENEDLKTSQLEVSPSYRSGYYLPPSYEENTPEHYPPYYEEPHHGPHEPHGPHGGYGFYPTPPQNHHNTFRSPTGGGSHNSYGGLALKGLLIPLAGIALLGAAAALSTNPILLQLGVINGKRRRRSTSENERKSLRRNY